MKKLLLVLLFLLIIVFIHGQEKDANNLDFGIACLIAVSDDTVAPGPGVAVSWYNSKLFGAVGIGTYIHLVTPLLNADYDRINMGMTTSLLAGINYIIFDNGTFTLPVTAGFHISHVTTFQIWTINLGIGTNIDFLWRFGIKWHAYGRVMAAYNFGASGEFLFYPGLGVGLSF